MSEEKKLHYEEKILSGAGRGKPMLVLTILLFVLVVPLFVLGIWMVTGTGRVLLPLRGSALRIALGIVLMIASVASVVCAILCSMGLKVMKPNEALVLTLFGTYYGTLKGEGF